MASTSLKLGTFCTVQSCPVSNEAASTGNTAFFAPLMCTSPFNGPLGVMINLSAIPSRLACVIIL
jgi:hypothetical protein